VTVLANADTGLARPDVFYFGNMVGETGDRGRDADVTAVDLLRTAGALFSNASIRNGYDHNRDGRVTVSDLAVVRRNLFTPPLRLISAPAGGAGATAMLRMDA
jgi:hypothetical protein